VQGTDGNLYGMTGAGGPNREASFPLGTGTVSKFVPGVGLSTLYSFCATPGCPDGFSPGALVQGADGNLYGTDGRRRWWPPSWSDHLRSGRNRLQNHSAKVTLTTLYDFCSQKSCSEWRIPTTLVQSLKRRLLRTTFGGGWTSAIRRAPQSGGMAETESIFEITPSGTMTTLHIFDGTNGAIPDAALVEAQRRQPLWNHRLRRREWRGTIFQISPAGAFTSLYSFTGSPALGAGPSGLFQATKRNLVWNNARRGATQRRNTL